MKAVFYKLLLFLLVHLLILALPSYAGELDMIKKGVVHISSRPPGGARKMGTGFIVQIKNGTVFILTASHVIAGEQHPKIEFYLDEKVDPLPANVLDGAEGGDLRRGLALLSVRPNADVLSKILALPFSPKESPNQSGQEILVVGYPGDAFGMVVIRGNLVGERGRDLQIDANISEGASGSPVLKGGYVIGLLQERGATYSEGNRAGSLRDFVEGYNVGALPSELPATPRATTQINESEMILVPLGPFAMGSSERDGKADERPAHQVMVKAFQIDKTETTVAEYEKYLRLSGKTPPHLWGQINLERDEKKPILGVNWSEAQSYCVSLGKRLPTEAEWEKAARGTDGRIFPWGNSLPLSNQANFSKSPTANPYSNGVQTVGGVSQGNSPYGVADMAGNAWEWVADWYDKDYYSKSPKENPKGPTQGAEKVLRGGSWLFGDIRSTARDSAMPDKAAETFGIRCAKDAK